MITWAETTRQAEARAGQRCEYCLMHQGLQGATFHIEHIVPRSRAGDSTLDNLAWCCPSCNLRKSNRIEVMDPATSTLVPLFHPRNDRWTDHFRIAGYQIVGLTPVGRATVEALEFNLPRRLLIRQAEEHFGFFPPGGVSSALPEEDEGTR